MCESYERCQIRRSYKQGQAPPGRCARAWPVLFMNTSAEFPPEAYPIDSSYLRSQTDAVDEDHPRTVLEFEDRFRTEDTCQAYLSQLWWPEGFRCPCFGHGQAWPTSRKLWQCRACGHDVSVTAGTVFHPTQLPLRVWFQAIWLVTNQKSG